MARIETNMFLANQKLEKLRYQLRQYTQRVRKILPVQGSPASRSYENRIKLHHRRS